jgi:hypothetical protein
MKVFLNMNEQFENNSLNLQINLRSIIQSSTIH